MATGFISMAQRLLRQLTRADWKIGIQLQSEHKKKDGNEQHAFKGFIDEVAIYNRALSEDEMKSLHDSYTQKTANSLQSPTGTNKSEKNTNIKDDIELLLKQAKKATSEHDRAQAIELYKQAVELAPEDVEANLNLAWLLYMYKDGQFANGKTVISPTPINEIATYFEKVLELDPNNGSAMAGLGNIAEENGDIDKAIELYKKNIEVSGDAADAPMHRLGRIYRDRGEYETAIKYFDMFLKIHPDAENVKTKRDYCIEMLEKATAETVPDETKIKETAQQLFEDIKNADYQAFLSSSNPTWWNDFPTWNRYKAAKQHDKLVLWICQTFKETPITNIEVGKVFVTDKEIMGETGWPAVTYKLTLKDKSIITGYLPFSEIDDNGKKTWQPMFGIDWHLRDKPILDKSYDINDKNFWTYGIFEPLVGIGVTTKIVAFLGEKDLTHGLRFCSELSGGKYPASMQPETVITDIQRWVIQEYSETGIDKKTRKQLRDEMLKTAYMITYYAKMQGQSPQYFGNTVTSSDKDKILLRWKISEDKYRVIYGDLRTDTIKTKNWDEAFAEAIAVIQDRPDWPETPEAVAHAFWTARAKKNYEEMKILWPGSGSWVPGWDEICKDDPNVKYVFGTASKDGSAVPYASEEHFKETGSYNLTMRMSSMGNNNERRYYIWSGN